MFYLPMEIRHRGAAAVLTYEACYILASYSIFRIALPDLDCYNPIFHNAMRCYPFTIFVIGMLDSFLLFVDLCRYYVWPWLSRRQRPNWPRWWLVWILEFPAIETALFIYILDSIIALVLISAGSMLSLFLEGGSTLRVVAIEMFYSGDFVLMRCISIWMPASLAFFLQILIIALTNSMLAPIIILGVSAIFLNYYKYAVV